MEAIGIDIGGTEIKGGRVSVDGTVTESLRTLSSANDADLLIDRVVEMIDSLGADSSPVGVGVPGLVDLASGRVVTAPNMPALRDVPLADRLLARTRRRALVRNDADMNAWGEFRAGAGRNTTHMICLTIGTGLGSGIITHGALYSGAGGYGAEAGHMVLDPDGRPCGCGGHGCMETVVSATGMVTLFREALESGVKSGLGKAGEPLTARKIVEAAEGGDALARSICNRVGRALGIGIASLINLFGPEAVVVGGGVSAAGSLLFDPAIAGARAHTYPELFKTCRIVPARLGHDAGVVGAALLAAGAS